MLLGTHLMAGAALGEAVGNPFLAFFLGFILHFVLDAIPHSDTIGDNDLSIQQISLVAVEGIIGISIFIYCYTNFSSHQAGFLAGAFGSILPDLFDNIPFWKRQFRNTGFGKIFHSFHYRVHSVSQKLVLGLSIQAFIIIAAFLLLRYLR